MKVEYVRLQKPELVFGETALLESELNAVLLKKQYHSFRMLRKKEFLYKVELKRAIEETKEHLDVVDKILPHTRYLEEKHEEKKLKQEVLDKIESAVEESQSKSYTKTAQGKATKSLKSPMGSIEKELAAIKARLAAIK